MKLVDVVQEQCFEIGARPADKAEAMRAVAAAAKRSPALSGIDEQTILDGLNAREELGSTGFGGGIAIPHCRVPGVTEFVVGLVTIPDGVDFEALDEKPIKLAVFIIGPDEASDRHVRLLSTISRTLVTKGAVKELVAAKSAHAARESLLRFSTDDLATKDRTAKCLVHLFVQNENYLADLMHGFAAVTDTSFVVVEAENASAYLTKLPMFAGFISDTRRSFSKVILAVADQKLKNEIVRQVEQVVGNLDDAPDTLLMIQDVTFAAGSLEA